MLAGRYMLRALNLVIGSPVFLLVLMGMIALF